MLDKTNGNRRSIHSDALYKKTLLTFSRLCQRKTCKPIPRAHWTLEASWYLYISTSWINDITPNRSSINTFGAHHSTLQWHVRNALNFFIAIFAIAAPSWLQAHTSYMPGPWTIDQVEWFVARRFFSLRLFNFFCATILRYKYISVLSGGTILDDISIVSAQIRRRICENAIFVHGLHIFQRLDNCHLPESQHYYWMTQFCLVIRSSQITTITRLAWGFDQCAF